LPFSTRPPDGMCAADGAADSRLTLLSSTAGNDGPGAVCRAGSFWKQTRTLRHLVPRVDIIAQPEACVNEGCACMASAPL
jgi:hypothetical protein